MPIIVRGSIIQERWETDGEKRSTVIINVEDFTFVSSGNPQSENSEEEKPGGKVAPKASAPPKGKAPAKKAKPPVDDDDDDDDEGF
jgi:single-stranded DNA-binding protein